MTTLTSDQRIKRAAAHANAARSDATIVKNFPHPMEPQQSKRAPKRKTFVPRSSFELARSFRAGHGRFS